MRARTAGRSTDSAPPANRRSYRDVRRAAGFLPVRHTLPLATFPADRMTMAPEAGGEDIRSVLSEIISKHLGCRDLWKVFSGFADDRMIRSSTSA